MPVDLLSFGYAALITAGGIFGYTRTGSIVSLGSGIAFGSVLCYGAFLTSQNSNRYGVIWGSSALLTGVMGLRYYNTGKIMPAGLVAALSLMMVGRFAARHVGLLTVKQN